MRVMVQQHERAFNIRAFILPEALRTTFGHLRRKEVMIEDDHCLEKGETVRNEFQTYDLRHNIGELRRLSATAAAAID